MRSPKFTSSIDPTDTNEVIWALCTRTDVTRDMDVLRRMWSTSLDPMAYQGEGPGFFNDRLVIDACRPFDRVKTVPAGARLGPTEAAEMRARWSALFTPDGAVARDVRVAGPAAEPTEVASERPTT